MSASAKFDFHINTIIKAAQIMSAWVLGTFMTRKTLPMLILLKTLIVSKVEYASILWSPSDQRNIANIENIQSRFTRKMVFSGDMTKQMGSWNVQPTTGNALKGSKSTVWRDVGKDT